MSDKIIMHCMQHCMRKNPRGEGEGGRVAADRRLELGMIPAEGHVPTRLNHGKCHAFAR